MIKRSFSVVMLALMVAPTYAVFGDQEDLPKAPKRMVRGVKNLVDGASDLADKAIGAAKNSINSKHVEKKEADKSPSQSEGPSSSNDDKDNEDKKTETTEGTNPEKPAEEDKKPASNNPGFFSRCTNSVVNKFVSTKKAVVGGVSAAAAGIYAGTAKVLNAGLQTGKFAVATVDPRTYWNAGKDLIKGKDGLTRFAIIKGHKEAVTGIVAATLATVGYVYREEIIEYGKKAYTWTANQVQSFRTYIQG